MDCRLAIMLFNCFKFSLSDNVFDCLAMFAEFDEFRVCDLVSGWFPARRAVSGDVLFFYEFDDFSIFFDCSVNGVIVIVEYASNAEFMADAFEAFRCGYFDGCVSFDCFCSVYFHDNLSFL